MREAAEVTRDARTVFVTQLVVRATDSDVRRFFEAVGGVKDVQLIKDKAGKSKGFGYVEFAELDSVPKALLLNGQKFCMKHPGCVCSGLPVQVKPSEAEKNYEAAAQTSIAAQLARVYLLNVPDTVTDIELTNYFKPYGELVTFKIFNRLDRDPSLKGQAFVQLKTQELAQKAATELASVPLLGQAVKLGTITSGGGVAVSATGESWEVIDEKSISAQDRATLIAQLSNAVQQEAVGLGATIVPGGRGKPKPVVQPPRPPAGALPTASMPGTGVVPGFPSLAFPIPGVIPLPGVVPSVPVGLPSRAILLKNMFDPSQETEEGWDLDIAEDVKEECEKHGPVLHVGVQKDSSGEVYVLFSTLTGALTAAPAFHGRIFAGKAIEVNFIPENVWREKFPQVAI